MARNYSINQSVVGLLIYGTEEDTKGVKWTQFDP